MVVGDNLALNSVLNFSESFSSTYFCRLCRLSKLEIQREVIENSQSLRIIADYEEELKNDNLNGSSIKSECILNQIPYFHVIDNFYVDVMHDIFEGGCHYVFCNAIIYFIQKAKFFTLDMLNLRKQTFDYGQTEIGSLSGKVELKHLNKKSLKMSASEMLTFALYFPLMVGDFIPYNDPVWQFLINYLEIIDILLCFETSESCIDMLEFKIKQHNKDYILLFNDTLKPKFHNLIHYPNIICQSGPLRKLWCFKYESKHRQFKVYSHCITTRKNICLTLAKKYELKFAFQLMVPQTSFCDSIFNEKFKIQSSFNTIICEKLKILKDQYQSYSCIQYKGTEFKPSTYISTFYNNSAFFLVLEIILVQNKLFLFCQNLKKIEFQNHYLAYKIDSKSLGNFDLIPITDLLGPPLNLITTARGDTVLRPKEIYKIVM